MPNLDYLKLKLKMKNVADLRKNLLLECKKFNFKQLARDVEPFLFVPHDSKKVLFFCDYIRSVSF